LLFYIYGDLTGSLCTPSRLNSVVFQKSASGPMCSNNDGMLTIPMPPGGPLEYIHRQRAEKENNEGRPFPSLSFIVADGELDTLDDAIAVLGMFREDHFNMC
jgi:hypothetical protein